MFGRDHLPSRDLAFGFRGLVDFDERVFDCLGGTGPGGDARRFNEELFVFER